LTIIDDYIPAAELTAYVREVPGPNNLFLENFLPDRFFPDIRIAIRESQRTNRAATYRNWDAETRIGKRDTFRSSEVRLAPLGQKLPVGEQETLEIQAVRSGGNPYAAMIDEIYNDVDNNVRSIYNRLEIARGDVLMDGIFRMEAGENDLEGLEADFGLDPLNNVNPAGADWDDEENSTPLTDLRAWMLRYSTLNGGRPGFMVMSETTIGHLAMNKQIRQQISGSAQDDLLVPYATDEQLTRLMQVNRFPTIVPYDTQIEFLGQNKRVLEDGKVIFLPSDPSSLGYTAWGITPEALMLVRGANGASPGLTFDNAAGMIGVVMREGEPAKIWSKVSAVAMPIISDIRRLMVATVY
jgi:hypothetical protein